MSHPFFKQLSDTRLLPIVTLDDPIVAGELANAIARGGIRTLEVTLRTSAALPAISQIATQTDLIVGAGTVLNAGRESDVAVAEN